MNKDISKAVRKLLPIKLKQLILKLPHYSKSNPFIQINKIFPDYNVSDFFLFRQGEYETRFIAENNLALLVTKKIECEHQFIFFNSRGTQCGTSLVSSKEFHHKLEITNNTITDEPFGSFIHQTKYSKKNLLENNINSSGIVFQHRGYAGYRKKNNKILSTVHGNFGALFQHDKNIRSFAKQRINHRYTPQVTFSGDTFYELAFSNPTSKELQIQLFIVQDNMDEKLYITKSIDPLGTVIIELPTSIILEDYNISWVSKLPIGRCLVFSHRKNNLDVFHS